MVHGSHNTGFRHGPLRQLPAQTREWPDTVTAALECPEGFPINYSQSYITRHEGHRITFRGTLATLEINRTELAVYEEGTRDIPSPLSKDEVMAATRRPLVQMKSI